MPVAATVAPPPATVAEPSLDQRVQRLEQLFAALAQKVGYVEPVPPGTPTGF